MEKPCQAFMQEHTAVRRKDSIVVFLVSQKSSIWMYNLWTEQWRMYTLPECLPLRLHQRGVEIRSDIYMYGGFRVNTLLWKLTRSTPDNFTWNTIELHNKDHTKIPLPREGQNVWEYDEKIWSFGGYVMFEYKELEGNAFGSRGFNDQLLCYDPFKQMWANVPCSGDIPSPRSDASVARMDDKVYLLGGFYMWDTHWLYELTMGSFTWTYIDITGLRPHDRVPTSFMPVALNKMVVYGDGFTRIFHVQSHTWKELWRTKVSFDSWTTYTNITGLPGSAVIVGTHCRPAPVPVPDPLYNPVVTVRLEPKSLQQLAMQMIHQKVDTTLWEMLPKKLRCKLMGTE